MKNCWKLMAWLMVLGLVLVGSYRPVLADTSEATTQATSMTTTSSDSSSTSVTPKEDLKVDRKDCSIKITIDSTGAATGGSFQAYRVAEITGENGPYRFKSLYGDVAVDYSDATKLQNLTNYYAEYVKNNNVAATCTTSAVSGYIKFTGLETGLYLIVQETAVSGYTDLATTLASVPYLKSDGTYEYEVESTSKPTITTSTTATTTETTDDTDEFDDDDDDTDSSSDSDSSSSSESKKLPQTGQLWWPLPLLLCGGLLLMFVGRRIRK